MTKRGRQIEAQLSDLPVEDLVCLHSRLTIAIYEREDLEGIEPDFWQEIKNRLSRIDAGNTTGIDAIAALAKL